VFNSILFHFTINHIGFKEAITFIKKNVKSWTDTLLTIRIKINARIILFFMVFLIYSSFSDCIGRGGYQYHTN